MKNLILILIILILLACSNNKLDNKLKLYTGHAESIIGTYGYADRNDPITQIVFNIDGTFEIDFPGSWLIEDTNEKIKYIGDGDIVPAEKMEINTIRYLGEWKIDKDKNLVVKYYFKVTEPFLSYGFNIPPPKMIENVEYIKISMEYIMCNIGDYDNVIIDEGKVNMVKKAVVYFTNVSFDNEFVTLYRDLRQQNTFNTKYDTLNELKTNPINWLILQYKIKKCV